MGWSSFPKYANSQTKMQESRFQTDPLPKISKGGIIEIDHDVFDCSGQFDGATIPLKCSWADSYREQEGFNQKSCDFELEQY